MRPINAYRAEDGTIFETEAEAVAHDKAEELNTRIDIFIDSHMLESDPGISRDDIKFVVKKWETFRTW